MNIKINIKKIYLIILLSVLFLLTMFIRFKISQPETPIFRYNSSIFSVSDEVYEVSSDRDIWKALGLGKTIDESSLKYYYKFNPKKELESYMVASFSEIYCINDKPLKGKLSDVVVVEFAYDVEYKGKFYEKGKLYIAHRTDKHSYIKSGDISILRHPHFLF